VGCKFRPVRQSICLVWENTVMCLDLVHFIRKSRIKLDINVYKVLPDILRLISFLFIAVFCTLAPCWKATLESVIVKQWDSASCVWEIIT
jgi:hypothetical protein